MIMSSKRSIFILNSAFVVKIVVCYSIDPKQPGCKKVQGQSGSIVCIVISFDIR